MGNCIAPPRPRRELKWDDPLEYHDILRVVKADGKVLEYKTPVLVRDLLSKFDGYGVGVARMGSQLLPPEHKLRTGRVYYLVPVEVSSASTEGLNPLAEEKQEQNDGCKRIKVVITKKQLKELLLKEIMAGELLVGQRKVDHCVGHAKSWRPQLEAILEVNE